MGKTRTISSLPIFRTLVFFILCLSIEFPTFFPGVSYAALFSSDKSTEEIAREYGSAVVFITAFDKDGKTLTEGSGFIVDPEGIIVTNYHCIEGASTAKARLTNGAYYDVEWVLGIDKDWDVAVLRMAFEVKGELSRRLLRRAAVEELPIPTLGDSDKLSVGERVVVIGNPLGLENTVSEGIISALRGRGGTGDVLIQFTAPISPGSSGGPVFNKKGEVIGVTTLYLKEGQNLNFAVPINRAKSLLKNRRPIALAEVSGREAASPPVPALTEKDTNPEALHHLKLGASFFQEGKFDLAISEFQEAIRLKPDYAEAFLNLGVAYDSKGLYDLAIRQYEEVIRLSPDLAGAYFGDGRIRKAKADTRNLGAAIGKFYCDTGNWPIWASRGDMTADGTKYDVLKTVEGEEADMNTGITVWTTDTDVDSFDAQLISNTPAYSTSGRRAWKGPYLGHESATADPWGTKYYANVEFLQPATVGGSKPVFVLSAGPNKLIETAFTQSGPSLTIGGDDIIFRIK